MDEGGPWWGRDTASLVGVRRVGRNKPEREHHETDKTGPNWTLSKSVELEILLLSTKDPVSVFILY